MKFSHNEGGKNFKIEKKVFPSFIAWSVGFSYILWVFKLFAFNGYNP